MTDKQVLKTIGEDPASSKKLSPSHPGVDQPGLQDIPEADSSQKLGADTIGDTVDDLDAVK
jgi:hypothetical protein